MKQENGYFIWNKGDDGLASYHFKLDEFACPCRQCDAQEQKISVDLVEKLEELRRKFDHSVYIMSGYRCPAKQAQLTKDGYPTAKGISQHELGNAADIHTSVEFPALFELVLKAFKATGKAPTWCHVDTRDDKERRWNYSH